MLLFSKSNFSVHSRLVGSKKAALMGGFLSPSRSWPVRSEIKHELLAT